MIADHVLPANEGNVTAMLWLGQMSLKGRVSGKPDPEEATNWFHRVVSTAGPGDKKARDKANEELGKLLDTDPGE